MLWPALASRPLRWSASAAAALCLGGCAREAPPSTAAATQPPALSAPPPPAQPVRGDPACLASLDAPSSRLVLRQARGELRIGVLAGLKESEDANLRQARALADQLKARGAEVLVALGDLGDNAEAQDALLGAIGAAGVPLLALAGNREVRAELDGALSELKRRGLPVVDLSRVRLVDLGDALLVGLPGAFERRQLRAEGACLYGQADLDALAAFLDKRPAAAPPALLLGAVPPRGSSPQALDASEGANVGDPRLLPLLTAARAPFGLFGQVWEAGGRGLDGAGRPVAPAPAQSSPPEPGVPLPGGAAQLYVNPGAADRTRWPMSDGTFAEGLAALLTIRGRLASYQVVRAAPQGAPEP